MEYNYVTNNENDFTKSEKNDTIKSQNKSQDTGFPMLNETQKSNIASAKHARDSGIITEAQYQDNLKKNGVKSKKEDSDFSLVKPPKEKLEMERLRKIAGQYNLNKVSPQKLDDGMRLKKKTPDDYYRSAPDLKEEKKRLDEVFGAKTDFSISNFENNYDKFNQEEKEMITHKMQLEFNNRGYTDKDGFKLKTDGIYGDKTKGVYEQYKKDNKEDYDDAMLIKKRAASENQPVFSTLKDTLQMNGENNLILYSTKNNGQEERKIPNEKTSLRKWLTENSKPPRNGKVYYDDSTLCVNGQSVDSNVKDLKYGSKPISYNGCELIAIYNALLLKNNKQEFKDIINKAEKTDKLLWLNGLWGSNPNHLDKLLDQYNQKYQKIEDSNYNKYIKEGGTYIFSFWNSDSIFDGIHTVAFTSDINGNIVVYNRYGNVKKPYIYNAANGKTGLDLLMEECGRGIVMYEIK